MLRFPKIALFGLALVLVVGPGVARADDEETKSDDRFGAGVPPEVRQLLDKVEALLSRFFGGPVFRFEPPAEVPGAEIHRASVRDTTVNGRRKLVLERDDVRHVFEVAPDGTIEGRVESPGKSRVFAHDSLESMRQLDPELHRVFLESSGEPSCGRAGLEFLRMPARPQLPPAVMKGVEDVFERAGGNRR